MSEAANAARRKAYSALDRWLQMTLAGLDQKRAKGQLLDTLQEVVFDVEVERIREREDAA